MLNHYGYTEQLANTVFIASSKQKKETTITGVRYKFIKLPDYEIFGLTNITISDVKIMVSDREKTIIDCFDYPEYCGGVIEAVKELWRAKEDIDFEKLVNYTKKIRNSAVAKRPEYSLEVLKIESKEIIEKLHRLIAKGFSPLDPLYPKKAKTNSRWNLILNISEQELTSWRGV